MRISNEDLLSVINYDPDTGIFTWLIDRHCRFSIKAGNRAGSSLPFPDGKKYRRLCYKSAYMLEHRAAFIFMGEPLSEDEEVDHENGNGEDNRWINLKRCKRNVNAKNLRKAANKKAVLQVLCGTKQIQNGQSVSAK